MIGIWRNEQNKKCYWNYNSKTKPKNEKYNTKQNKMSNTYTTRTLKMKIFDHSKKKFIEKKQQIYDISNSSKLNPI